MTTSPKIRVAGSQWMSAVAAGWGDPTITHRREGGCWEMSWDIPVRKRTRHPALLSRQPVDVFMGGTPIWSGVMSEPDWDTGEMVALGWCRQGEEAICFDGTGKTTSTPDVAVDQAIARGALGWIRRTSISATPFAASGSTDKLNYVTALLDAFTTQASTAWGVNARREVVVAPSPTTASLVVTPDAGELGVTEALAGTVYGRYLKTNGLLDTTSVGAGNPEVGIDLTKLGPIDVTRARAVLAGILDQLGPRTGWTNGLTLTAEQITNPGGARVNLATVTAWSTMMRLAGLRDVRGLGASTSIVLDETVWDVAEGTVQATPVGMAARDLGSIIEDAGGVVLQ